MWRITPLYNVRIDYCTIVTKNQAVIRAVVATSLTLALQLAAIWAPLVHLHPDDHADHHGAPPIHAHFSGHAGTAVPSGQAELAQDDDERAVFLQLFVAVAATTFPAIAAPASLFTVVPAIETSAHPPVDVVHGHDPPFMRSLPSRAPPAANLS